MKKVLVLTIVMVSSFSFASIKFEDFQEEILKSKTEQILAYAGVKQALGEDYRENMPEQASANTDTMMQIKVVRLDR